MRALTDHRLSPLGVTFAIIAALKAIDVYVRWQPAMAMVWVAAGLLCLLHLRSGFAAIVAVSVLALVGDFYSNHLVWLLWVSLTFVIFGDDERRSLVLRLQLTILYAFAGVAKLNPEWLSGEALTARGFTPPGVRLLAMAVILLEVSLAIAIWVPRLRPALLVVAAVAHASFLALPDGTPMRLGITVFGLTTLTVLAWSTAQPDTPHGSRTARVAPS